MFVFSSVYVYVKNELKVLSARTTEALGLTLALL